jgi:hypothetical protein
VTYPFGEYPFGESPRVRFWCVIRLGGKSVRAVQDEAVVDATAAPQSAENS